MVLALCLYCLNSMPFALINQHSLLTNDPWSLKSLATALSSPCQCIASTPTTYTYWLSLNDGICLVAWIPTHFALICFLLTLLVMRKDVVTPSFLHL